MKQSVIQQKRKPLPAALIFELTMVIILSVVLFSACKKDAGNPASPAAYQEPLCGDVLRLSTCV